MTIKHLVVSGGGPTLFQSLGAIQYLEQNGFIDFKNIESIYGTSAGAIISVCILLKFDWDTLTEYFIKRPWHKIFSIKAQNIFDAYSKKGLFDNSAIEKCFKPLFDAKDISMEITMKEFFEYNGHEIHIFTFELNSFESVDISYKTHPNLPLIQVLHMTCSLPVIVSPVFIENKCYIDGGISCNYPLNKCIEANGNVDEIIGFVNDYSFESNNNTKESNNITKESSLIEFILGLFFKIIKSMETDAKQEKIKNEVAYKAQHVSVGILKEALYSSEIRQQLFQSGVDAAKEFLEKKKEEDEKEEKEKGEKNKEENIES
jgi:predicted acylesterase/phospholipase RssA